MNIQRLLSATALVGVLAVMPAVAQAKNTADAPASPTTTAPQVDPNCDPTTDVTCKPGETAEKGKDIVITGSRIARPTLSSPIPVTTINSADLLAGGQLNIGDALNHLPALRSTFSQANSTRFIGTSGLSILDLRGLGTARTLVLVNGRRHITSEPGDYLVDTNTIPEDLLERVDVVTGGNSAVYGSDAVAGVVNFVMKKNFTGVSISGQGGISSHGDRGAYFVSAAAGTNFADGRGNIAIAGEYSKNNPLYNIDRDDLTGAYSGRNQFNTSSDSTKDGPTDSEGVFDQSFFRGVRNGTIGDGGELTAICPSTAAGGPAMGTILAGRCRASRLYSYNATTGVTTYASANNAERYFFQPGGNLQLSQPTIDFRDITNGLSSNTVGGLGSTLNNTGQLDPGLERMSFSMLAHFDITPAFKPFLEAKFVRIHSNQEGQPSFFQGSLASFFATTNAQFAAISELRCNNPFLNAQALATLQSIGRCANPATGLLTLSRFNVDFGGRGELHQRDTFRVVGGVEGTFNNDWSYEVAANYGQLDTHLTSLNNLKLFDINGNLDGFLLATNAVVAPAGFTGSNFEMGAAGQKVVCAVNATASGNVRPDCVPINLFGSGSPSAAALAFVNTTSTRVQRATELDLSANMTGNLSKLFTLPGGPIAFNLGAEYRRETARSQFDALTASGGTFLNAIQPFLPPALAVKEAFGEVQIPILKDLPFAEEFTVSGAGRVSSYNTQTGTVWTYNASAIYAPIKDIRFRAGFSRSVRAPTQSDLFSPQSQNFALVTDPCDVAAINTGSSTRAANCAAAGVPVGFVNTPARTQTLSYLSGGNPALQAEKSNSYTYGVVLAPRFTPGLVVTVDYYNINVNQLISTLSLQTILNQCYDSPTLNNSFCGAINPRNSTTHEFATPYVGVSGGINFARQQTRGIDVDVAYNRELFGGRLSFRAIGTYVLEKTNYLDPVNPNNPTRQLGTLGDPQFDAQATIAYETAGGFSFRYQAHYIGLMSIGTYESQHSVNGNPPQNPDLTAEVNYPGVLYHAVRFGAMIDKKFEFYVGVDNLTNKYPPFLLTGAGAGSAIYDNIGRFFYSGVKLKFK